MFRQPLLLQADLAHSQGEARWAAPGHTAAGRDLMLVFTFRATRIRVMFAWPMSRREREVYRRAESQEAPEADPGA